MDSDQAKIFVGGISRETNEDSLTQHFSVYGTVLGSVVAKDRTTNLPRGFGFVSFSETASAERALGDSHTILGRTVEVKRARPRSEQQHQHHQQHQQLEQNHSQQQQDGEQNDGNSIFKSKKIFVGGLPGTLTEENFKIFFEKFGTINDVVVMRDSLNQPRGFGFVTFDTEESVENVLRCNFYELDNRVVEVKRAIPKEKCNASGIGNCSTSAGVVVGGGAACNGSQCATSQNQVGPPNGISPGYAPPMFYNNVGMATFGTGGYCFAYPMLEYNRLCYGFPPFPSRVPLYNPMVCQMPFDIQSFYHTYLPGGAGIMGMGPGGYMVNGPGMEGKLIQGPVCNGPRCNNVLPRFRALTLGPNSSPKIRISSIETDDADADADALTLASQSSGGQDNRFSDSNGGRDISGESNGVGQTTSGESNGVGQTTSSESNGVGQTTSSESNGVGQTTSGESNGVGQTTSSESNGGGQTTSGESNGVGQTTSSESNGGGQTNSSESNGGGQTTSGESNGGGQTTSSENNGGGDIFIEITVTPNESNGGGDKFRNGGGGGGDTWVESNGGGEMVNGH